MTTRATSVKTLCECEASRPILPRKINPRAMALRWCLKCQPDDPLREQAVLILRAALAQAYTQREAASVLGITEVYLSTLLKDFPNLKPNN